MPYVLDTNTITALQHRDRHAVSRVQRVPGSDIFVAIVSFEEQIAGRLNTLNRQLKPAARIVAYTDLSQTLYFYTTARVLPYDDEAAHIDDRLRMQLRRMGTFDRRIAAITLAHGYTLVTRNTVHFKDVPGLTIEDWMAPDALM